MVICKFFLQGTCRFGSNCRNDHYLENNGSVLHQNYSLDNRIAPAKNTDINSLIKSVVNDMTCAEKGGQWLLSCYSPFKEKAEFPGFTDLSMEEMRFQFYESLKNGTVEQFKRNLQQLLQRVVNQVKALQNPSPEAINVLKSIYNNENLPKNQQLGHSTNIFGSFEPQQSIPEQTSAFSFTQLQIPEAKSAFLGQPNDVFANKQTNQPFFTQPSPPSIFGNQRALNAPLLADQPQNPVFTQNQEDFYSKREELTKEDINWFTNDDLDPLNIPERPPCYDMCF